ncbi:hypothetical protein A2U01_0055206, partial [Trifolium medium]|nr:hypothetical protein [Trifolium medium]
MSSVCCSEVVGSEDSFRVGCSYGVGSEVGFSEGISIDSGEDSTSGFTGFELSFGSGLLRTVSAVLTSLSNDENMLSKTFVVGMDDGMERSSKIGIVGSLKTSL